MTNEFQPSKADIVNNCLLGLSLLKKDLEFDYLAESAVTASDQFHSDQVDPEVLSRVVQDCISSLQALDKIKKSLFYGRALEGLDKKYVEGINDGMGARYEDTDVVHAVLGIATEAGELLEALQKSLFGDEDLDYVNLFEEVGDVQWYEAMLLRRAGRTFDDVQHNNIEKLRARFGDKFSEYDANNRNLAVERQILENGLTG